MCFGAGLGIMDAMRHIGIYVDRQRAWSRRLCEGIAAYAQTVPDWALSMLDADDIRDAIAMRRFDGFIARVQDRHTAKLFRRAGRLVADISSEKFLGGLLLRGVMQDNAAIGRLAARHFIERLFTEFAFCGYNGRRFSDERRDAFVRCLRLNRFRCTVYESPKASVRDFGKSVVSRERLAPGADSAALTAWAASLPKPVAVFCANDLRAHQFMQACKEAGAAVPQEVAILGVDNDTLTCNFATPSISSIDPDAFALGHAAAEYLDRRLNGDTTDSAPKRIEPKELVVRGSTDTFPVDPPWLAEALTFIRRNINRHLTASDVYAHVGLSHTRVNSMFRAKLGSTVQKTIRKTALAEAQRLLSTTSLPVAEIARRSGFASQQYFCRVFTLEFGTPPSARRASKIE